MIARLRGSVISSANSGKCDTDGVVEVDQALVSGERQSRGGEALAERVQQTGPLGRVRRPPTFGDDVSVPQHHQAVQLDGRIRVHRVHEREDSAGVDALLVRCTPRETTHARQTRHVPGLAR